MEKMQFTLFSEISFEVSDPVALIECFCYQSDFYKNYDLLLQDKSGRTVKNVNKIGARIKEEFLEKCERVLKESEGLEIFKHEDIDSLLKLDENELEKQIKELNDEVVQKLLGKDRIGFSKVTKILHTCYPKLIPMIDNPLQEKYKEMNGIEKNKEWTEELLNQLFVDYYNNLNKAQNLKNLNAISKDISENNIKLTKVRLFDILWWSFLKAENLKRFVKDNYNDNIKWSTIEALSN